MMYEEYEFTEYFQYWKTATVILENLLKSLLRKVTKRCYYTANSESIYNVYIFMCIYIHANIYTHV